MTKIYKGNQARVYVNGRLVGSSAACEFAYEPKPFIPDWYWVIGGDPETHWARFGHHELMARVPDTWCVHVLRCDADPFDAIEAGLKTWEFRRNDRDFAVGDLLELWRTPKLTDPPAPPSALRPRLRRRVTYLLPGGQYGIPDGYCIMSLGPE